MQNIELSMNGRDFVFAVKQLVDTEAGNPWENEDGHGPVTGYEDRAKRPGELVLVSDFYNRHRFYDFAAAVEMAKSEGWDTKPYNTGNETKGQQAAKAARADFEFLRQFCNGHWEYVGIVVTLLDDDGEETSISESLLGICSNDDEYLAAVAHELAGNIAAGYGRDWTKRTVTTEKYIRL